jgi:adenine-specific DNA-methyltransferase
LRGRDIKRYSYDFADLWLINTHNGIKEKGIKPIDIADYPAIKKHLDTYYPQLEKRADKGETPYNLRNCAYIEDFSKQKIIFQEMVQEPSFILDEKGDYMCLDTARIIVGEELDLLLTIMNSKLFFYSIKTFYGGGGLGETGVRMKHTFFENFPMPKLNESQKNQLRQLLIEPILKSSEINTIIYSAYNFDNEEIGFIEFQ